MSVFYTTALQARLKRVCWNLTSRHNYTTTLWGSKKTDKCIQGHEKSEKDWRGNKENGEKEEQTWCHDCRES